ncbi:MAG: hypothetical protein ACXVC2_12575 [Bacteroidia bacterium]
METKKIFILTQSFPYGDKETPFIYNELKRISENFSEVVILPFSTKGKNDLPLPPNVTIEKVFEDYNYKISIKTVGYCFLKLPIALPDLISNLGVLLKKGNLKNYLSLYLQTADKFIHFKKKADLLINENSLVYSFWFNEWVTLFAIYRNRNINLISRAHGFDLYENRHTFTFIPFRKYSIKHLNKLVAISENGFLYLNERYYQMKNKFHFQKFQS